MIKNRLVFFLSACLLSACNKAFDGPEQLMEYVSDEDNGYQYSKSVSVSEYLY